MASASEYIVAMLPTGTNDASDKAVFAAASVCQVDPFFEIKSTTSQVVTSCILFVSIARTRLKATSVSEIEDCEE